MEPLKAFQKRYLRGLAHGLKPVIFVGRRGLTPALATALNDALDHHELVKIKFNDFKEKKQKQAIAQTIEETAGCELVGLIGHMATFYRRQPDPERRKVALPPK
jgi:RNA-binding protein